MLAGLIISAAEQSKGGFGEIAFGHTKIADKNIPCKGLSSLDL
ncbi:hypothetical protein DSM43518_03543 [Mycobacterium marinum]|uniref:Uncharacterized protein n=1 Tax=Mycobacterium marinum TaxID=1781 RepID=A0A3E2MU52_MYCMR|nr:MULTISPECIES: hypothetical protein [Mycobacterium]AXN45462.1 hypothetical protein MM1218R_03528 [Mycobacterium marinum]AXN50738.1 hypothetical protein CCUG20998_03335 [Mycobacterium marinum]EPQ46967.1 hypothetical protein MMSP_2728 [Mycobacterium sp. 012931]EPQ75133.1 hypothetical protein MMEU_2793 [Mycobacterium marinum str. Europe]MDC8973347.1 hypothetical protein [Mycobacterium marinum]